MSTVGNGFGDGGEIERHAEIGGPLGVIPNKIDHQTVGVDRPGVLNGYWHG